MNSTLDDLIHTALKTGATVELELCDGYGYTYKIDGEYVIPPKHDGLPHESFDIPLKWFQNTERLKNWLDELKQKAEADSQ